MDAGITDSIGGLGLFLLGMVILTSGLKDLAGGTIRRMIARFTKSIPTGIATGVIVTAILQSSSATTVTAVGFAGAGLLTLTESLGIVFGANLGTTVTGWIVVLFGFKLKLGQIAFPLVLVGVLLNLFGKKRIGLIGFTIAGFSLIFVGLDILQEGMSGLAEMVSPESFPQDSWWGRLLLLLMGVGIVLVTQSSSAGVVMALTALHSGAISLAQAGALVIGFGIGTTFTALLASLGKSVAARRTGLAHVFYSLVTATLAYFLLPVYVWFWEEYAGPASGISSDIALVTFHTLFNLLGLMLIVPFTKPFSALIIRLIPEAVNDQTERLDESLLSNPNVAIEAARSTLVDVFQCILQLMHKLFTSEVAREELDEEFAQYHDTLETTSHYLRQINVTGSDQPTVHSSQEVVLALDHLQRLMRRCDEMERLSSANENQTLSRFVDELNEKIQHLEQTLNNGFSESDEGALQDFWENWDSQQKETRREFTQSATTADGQFDNLLQQLDAFRWLTRISYHLWRIVHHLQGARLISNGKQEQAPAAPRETEEA
ncbi:Na/Pi symporter [Gimesia sp.]|uniref:Na/Pi cotransporter family protein n=1 Tax=Gimesia sp. TaxID=2024833 RepID=UPI000C67E194|nr:Na/Pi symporter [Gimesia sp.]MAX40950.1 Na/Pi-cotransporter II-like protein [Gimesia sp.]HBL42568.1 Na/Pi cotransporter family protein [Planctomycetaceae bacterium]|tara:strand:- start:8715 stop:10352 length:1638 start_codon:yes stop_codon:yes gene_type:complete